MEAAKKADFPRIIGVPEDADALAILRIVIAQKRADADQTAARIDAREEEITQSRVELDNQYHRIHALEVDADRLEAASNGVISCGG